MKVLNITDIVTLPKCRGLFITIIYLEVATCFAHSFFDLCQFSADTMSPYQSVWPTNNVPFLKK